MISFGFDLRTAPRTGDVTGDAYIKDPTSRAQLSALEKNVRRSGIPYYGLRDERQGNTPWNWFPVMYHLFICLGIVHVIGGEQGFIVRLYHSENSRALAAN